MIPYSQISSRLIKPYNLYTYTKEAKQYFMARFGDKKSFIFLHNLIRYCNEENEGNWPDKITSKVITYMSDDAKVSIEIEEMKAFIDGYVIKTEDYYELTHEFIVASFMCCPDGNFLPLSTGHIDFTKTQKFAEFLKEEIFIEEPQAVKFLTELVVFMSKERGVLLNREFMLGDLIGIAKENNLIIDLCLDWAQLYNLINSYQDVYICNGLILSAYYAMPRLN